MDETPARILLIEDSATYTVLVEQTLAKAVGVLFEVHTADRLSAGLARLASTRFDAILLDLTLPDSQGIETLERIRAAARSVPIVVLTALDDETLAVKALQEGAADYLVKGEVTPNWLVRSLHYAVERGRAEKPIEVPRKLLPEKGRERLTIKAVGDVAVASFHESIIISPTSIKVMERELFRLIERSGCRKLLLNFADVDYFSNAAMGMLVVLHKKLNAAQGRLRLCALSPEVHENFSTRRLDDVFDICDSQDSALNSF